MNDEDKKISRRRFLKASSLVATGGLLLGSDALASATKSDLVADAVYFNGKIATLDATESTVGAVAVKDGKILKVGSSDEIKKLAGTSTRMVDLGGKTVVPGLIDAHCHPMETIMMKDGWVDARYPACPSVKQALANIAAWIQHTPKGKWVFVACVSASENKFAEKRLPTKAELDSVAPDNPVILADGAHLAVVNSMALKLLGITKGVSELKGGGRAILDKDGEPNGTLTDAMGSVPTTPSLNDLERYYGTGIQDFWKEYGFTSLLAITPAAALPVLQAVSQKRKPDIRYTVSVWTDPNTEGMPENLDKFKMPAGADPAFYRFGAIKAWVDGENDCRTGLMYERYKGHFDTDPPGDKGTLVTPTPKAEHFADIANRNGVICMLHCSGDKAMDMGLDAYAREIKTRSKQTMMRIEHFGMFQMSDQQLRRAGEMKKQGLFVCVQPTWLLELVKADYENMGAFLAKTGFRFRSMIDAGLEPSAGTDMTGIYLANINPFSAIYACVTRNSDKGIFEPKEAVTVTEALKMWTIWAAKSMGEEKVKGTIEPGKYADMTVLSDDIFTMPTEGLKDVKTLKTIVGGNVVYEAK
ncbi:MAG: amidohydrolase [Desulfomonile tiedjei]|uniref:Amidohydrolase n=1 Tax=Desulfomonile tiedjei TaxID=2358 RepID=A0A9D6Z2N5_9BACT|nr:amidohydrolase [Desulfomonile tiedjei]